MTLTALLTALDAHPGEGAPHSALVDWLLEFGTDDDWNAALDRRPSDHGLRARYAGWLADRGDERSEGYRAMAALRVQGYASDEVQDWVGWTNERNVYVQAARGLGHLHGNESAAESGRYYMQSSLPADWFDSIGTRFNVWAQNWKDRREAEDAAARAFRKLPAARRRELLTRTRGATA